MKKLKIIIFSVVLVISQSCLHKYNNHGSTTAEAIHSEDEHALEPLADQEAVHEDDHEHNEGDHMVDTVKKRPFAPVIRTSGRITVDSRDIEIITAKSSGIVKFSDHFLFPGVKTGKGKILFTISGDQLAENNTDLDFRQITADLEKARANFERAKELITDRIITQEHFLGLKNEYDKTVLAYNNLSETFSEKGNSIAAPGKGYIKEIFVTEGQMVNAGQPLASIVIEHNLVLKADISPEHLAFIPSIEKANFTVGYSNRLFRTDEMNGKVISYGRSTGENSWYIPVYFRMDHNPELIEGTFAEVYLVGKMKEDAIVIPNSALMEEFGSLYVFLENEDGEFIKRYIRTGYSDGEYTQITDGLHGNEIIVTHGAYNVKLSLMTNSAPAHNHNH